MTIVYKDFGYIHVHTWECKKSTKKINLMDAKIEHFGRIRRCFQWRHSREEPYTSRRRIIAQAQIFNAFTSPEVEVNIIQRWLIVTSLQRGGFPDPGHINVVLREIPCEDKFSFLNVKSCHIFHVWKARRTMVIEGRDREWLRDTCTIQMHTGNNCRITQHCDGWVLACRRQHSNSNSLSSFFDT